MKHYLFRRMAVFVVLLVALAMSIAAPLSVAQSTPQADGSVVIVANDEPIAATPTGEQVLRIAPSGQSITTLDPALCRDFDCMFLVRQVFRGLVRLDDDLNPVPELADRIEISADGLTYSFHVRDNAAFQDGTKITSTDAIDSITRALDPATANGDWGSLSGPTYLSGIVGVGELGSGSTDELSGLAGPDEQTVVITLASPDSAFLLKLASTPGSIVDLRDLESGPDWSLSPNGSGPFAVASLTPELMVLEASPTYFAGKPTLERIEIRNGLAASQPFNLYQRGDIDFASLAPFEIDRAAAVESGFSEDLRVTPQFGLTMIIFSNTIAPLDDPHIRRAIQLGFPREKIADVMYESDVHPAAGIIPTGMLEQDWPVDWPAYDPEAAKAEIATSRYGSAESVPTIQIYVAGGAETEALRDVLFETTGLRIEVIQATWGEFLDGLSEQRYPAFQFSWMADYPDPSTFVTTLFGPGSFDNYVGYDDPQVADLLASASRTLDVVERADLYAQAQQIILDAGVVMPLYYPVDYSVVRPTVKGLNMTPIGLLGLERVWMQQ